MKKITIILLVIITAFMHSCIKAESDKVIETVSVEAFEKLINEKTGVLVDVRTEEEFQEGHIDGALLMDVEGDNFKLQIKALDKKVPVLVYCRSGRRSLVAAEILKTEGFVKIYNLDGGFNDWVDKH